MPRRRAALTTLGVCTLSLALIGCAETASPSTDPGDTPTGAVTAAAEASSSVQAAAEGEACSALQTWSDEMHALGDMDTETASADDVEAQLGEIETAWDEVLAASEGVESADQQAVSDAGQELETAIDDASASDDVPIAQVIDDVEAAAQPLRGV